MSAGSGYNDWESDLSSIIEKTNQNLKLLRRIGDKRTDLTGAGGYDVSTTATRPATATSAAQIASDMRSFASSISSRYAAEDGSASASARARGMSTTGIPRSTSAASSSSKKLHRSSSMGVENARERARESLIIRPSTAFGSDGEGDGDDRSPRRSTSRQATTGSSSGSGSATRSNTLKRSSSVATGKPRSGSTSSTRMSTTAAGVASGSSSSNNNNTSGPLGGEVALDELRKSLEVHVASRSSAFEKALGDLRTDMTVVSTETNALSMKMHELRDAVTAKLSNIASTTQAVSENGESIGRLEKHSAVLLGWKVGVDQDLFEISTKLKSFSSIQEKMASLESHLEALGTAIKNAHRAARYDEKIDELKDRLAMMERQAAHQVDAKAVEHTVQMRVSKEINELENRIQQSLQFLTQKLENKIQALEKSVCSDRIDAIASLKSELMEDIDKLDSKTLKKPELVPLQNTQTQIKDDIAHMQMFFERQDKRFQELKQNSTQIRDELVETRQELTKALHAQQNRVSTTLEEKVAQLAIMSKDKNVKVDQKMTLLEKRHKKIEDQTKALHDAVDKVKHDAVSRRAVDSVTQQRENEKLRLRLAKSIAELEQLHTAKQELERSMETQERQYQTKIKELRVQVEAQEKSKETERTELLQAIQNESKQMGYSQGRSALLESLLAREKQENEEKSQHIHKARQEIAQIRQKMRSLESDVDRKMQKLSTELQSKQSQVDVLVKKLKRSEEDAQKLVEAAKREKKSLARTKELKQQELVVTKMKLKEMEKIITTVIAVKDTEASVAKQHMDHASGLADVESKRKQLESLLAERHLEIQDMRLELEEAKLERDELMTTQHEELDIKIHELTGEYVDQIQSFEREIAAKDAEMKRLREELVDRSELLELDNALAQLKSEKESLVQQLEVTQSDQERRIVEIEASLSTSHREEMEKLRSKMDERVTEITALQKTLIETGERLAVFEATSKQMEMTHTQEVGRLAQELKDARADVERLMKESTELEAAKRRIEDKLVEVQAALEANSADDEEHQEAIDRLRLSCEELGAERQRLVGELKSKCDELAELTKLDAQHRERLAEVMNEQDASRTQLEAEIGSLRETMERERAASAQCEQELKATITTLEEELNAERKQAQEGASGSSKLQVELESALMQLTAATQAEAAMKSKFDVILDELSSMGLVFTGGVAADPASLLRKHVSSMTEKHSRDLAAVAAEHEDALKRAAADSARAQQLESHIQELTAQIEDLEDANRELKGDMEKLCAEKARHLLEMGRLQEEIAEIRDQKAALEDQVEHQLAQYEELDATLRSQIEEKDAEVGELKEANADLEKTINDIHETMEQIETSKITELDSLSMELQELELTLVGLTGSNASKATSMNEAAMEKELFANQQAIVSAGQQIRALYAKLCSGCSILELQDLKASLAAVEAKHEWYREESQRDRQQCVEAEEQVVLNVEFLEALVVDSEGKQNALAAKYVKTAPSLAAKLCQLQEMFHDALQQCSLEAAASLATDKLTRKAEISHESPEREVETNLEEELFDDDPVDDSAVSEGEDAAEEMDGEDELESSAQDLNESISELEVSQTESAAGGRLDGADDQENADHEEDCGLEEQTSPHSAAADGSMLQLDPDHSTRADACTTLMHSPTAALLHEPFQGFRSKPDRLDQLDDTPRAESCTTLLHSPTASLLQEQFKSFDDQGPTALKETFELSRDDDHSDFDDEDDDSEAHVPESRHEEQSPAYSDTQWSLHTSHTDDNESAHGNDDEDGSEGDRASTENYDAVAVMAVASLSAAGLTHSARHADTETSLSRSSLSLKDQHEDERPHSKEDAEHNDADDDEMIDSESDEEVEGDVETDADGRMIAVEDDAESELEQDDDGELSQSLEAIVRQTTEPNAEQVAVRVQSRQSQDDDDDEPRSDEEDNDNDNEHNDHDAEAHSGFNSPSEKAESEFSDDTEASMDGSAHADETAETEAHADGDEATEDSREHVATTISEERSIDSNRSVGQAEPSLLRVDAIESAASDINSEHDEDSESANEIDGSLDSADGKVAMTASADLDADPTQSISTITASSYASSTVALSRLAALRKDSDEDDVDVAQRSSGFGGQRTSGDDDDEFDQIDDDVESEHDEGLRSEGESAHDDDEDDRQASIQSSEAIETAASRQETTATSNPTDRLGDVDTITDEEPSTSAGVDVSFSRPLSGIAALREDSDEIGYATGSLSLASATTTRSEKEDEDGVFGNDRGDDERVDEIDQHSGSELDASSDVDEIDKSHDLRIEPPSAEVSSTPTTATAPLSRISALRKDSGEDDDDFDRAQLSLNSRRRDSGNDFDDEDDEFGALPVTRSEVEHSEDEPDDNETSQGFPHEEPSPQIVSSSSLGSVVATAIPSLPLAALRKSSEEEEDEVQAAQLAMNSRRRDATNDHDDSFFDDEDDEEQSLQGSEHREDRDEETDVGDFDASQDFGDDVGLPSFGSPGRTMSSSSSRVVDRQRDGELSLRTASVASDADHDESTKTAAATVFSSHTEGIKEENDNGTEHNSFQLESVERTSTGDARGGDSDFDDDEASPRIDGSDMDDLEASQQFSEVDELDVSVAESETHMQQQIRQDSKHLGLEDEQDKSAKSPTATSENERGDHDGDSKVKDNDAASEHDDEDERDGHDFDQSASFDDADFDHHAENGHGNHDRASAGEVQSSPHADLTHAEREFDHHTDEEHEASHQLEGSDVDELNESQLLDGSEAGDELSGSQEESEVQTSALVTETEKHTESHSELKASYFVGSAVANEHHAEGEEEDAEDARADEGRDFGEEDDRESHDFDQSASFDEAVLDHYVGSGDRDRVSSQQPQLADRRGFAVDKEDEDGDAEQESHGEVAAGDDSMDDSMDEVERLLLQHAEESDLPIEGDRYFTSSLRMEDDGEDQDGDELIDSDEEEEEEEAEIGADSMRSDDASEATASPLPSKGQYGASNIQRDEDNDDEDDAQDMDEMERLLHDVSTTPAKPRERKKSEASSDEEEEVAASSFDTAERPVFTPQASRLSKKSFDDSDDEEEEVAAVPSPVHLPSSQLLPLSGLGSRARGAGGGSGSLMKALNASRSAGGALDELDDDMDEVEKLMATKSHAQRKPLTMPTPVPVVSSLQSSSVDKDFDASDDEEDEIDRSGSSSPVAAAVNRSTTSGFAATAQPASTGHVEASVVAKEGDKEDDENVSDEEDALDESVAEESGAFGLSFGDDDLDRALASPTAKANPSATSAATAPVAKIQASNDSDSDDDHKPSASNLRGSSLAASSSLLTGPGRQLGSLQPLPALGKKPLPGLGALGRSSRMVLDEDDDMDEVERLLLQQTSMKTATKPTAATTTSATASKTMAKYDEEEDDEFDASGNDSPLRRPDLPIAQDKDDEFAHFDRDDGEDDGSSRKKATRETSNLSDSQGSAASPSRIPILRGSTLLKKPLASSPAARPRMASARSEDDYLEDSFDMEESLEEEEDV